jgi:AraC-like DNA-binding protein
MLMCSDDIRAARSAHADSSGSPTPPNARAAGDDTEHLVFGSSRRSGSDLAGMNIDELLGELDDHLVQTERSVHALHSVSTTLFGASSQAMENRAIMAARSHLARARFDELVARYEQLRDDFHRLRDEMPTAGASPPRWGEPAVIARAITYMRAHLDERAAAARAGNSTPDNLTVADIAAASRIGSRALQQAFRRHRGTTPINYLRDLRFERAHQDLKAADPTLGDTVGAIAKRWGFTHLSHFSTGYRDRFGCTPRQTLRT